jgi:hypothetical protein
MKLAAKKNDNEKRWRDERFKIGMNEGGYLAVVASAIEH